MPAPVAAAPSSDPQYAATDAPQTEIPSVRAQFAGKTVAVVPYVNKTLSEYRFLGDASVGILPEYLLQAGFQPIESEKGDLKSILDELKYGQSDNVNPATAAQIGEHLGARYVFIGEVNSYRVVTPKGDRGISIAGFSLDSWGGQITYDIQVSGRLVDVTTRAIVASKTVSHNQSFKATAGGLRTPWGSFRQSQGLTVENEVGAKILGVALNRLVSGIVSQLNARQVATN